MTSHPAGIVLDALPFIVVVEDEATQRELLVDYLSRHGFRVSGVDTGGALRQLMDRELPALVMLDVGLPGEDGFALARWMRERNARIGIIMVSAATDTVDRVVGLETGADDYIAKPFDARELLARVKSVLRRKTLEPGSTAPRRLAAILAADIAGYSRLVESDEEGTLDRMRALRQERIDPTLAAYRGRIFKTTGDGILVEFTSVVDAVRCAIALQRDLAGNPLPRRSASNTGSASISATLSSMATTSWATASTLPRASRGLPNRAASVFRLRPTTRFSARSTLNSPISASSSSATSCVRCAPIACCCRRGLTTGRASSDCIGLSRSKSNT